MQVYHGSDHCFRKLRISQSLVERQSTLVNEGCGIYFSTDRFVAETYGKYVYAIELKDITDYRKKEECIAYFQKLFSYVKEVTNIAIDGYLNVSQLITNMHCGGISIANMDRELSLILDNNEKFYNNTSETKRQAVYRCVRKYNKENLHAYMFRYHINNIGVIKDLSYVISMRRTNRI